MADLAVLREYLVKIGYSSDQAQYNQVSAALDRLRFQVQQHVSVINNTYVKLGAAVASVYAAIGTATLGMMESVSRADLGYTLYAQKIYMGVDAAKRLKVATDALGYSLDEIAWNPELAGRFRQLLDVQKQLVAGLGPEFAVNMRRLRDMRFEFTKLHVELQYVAQSVTDALFKGLGFDSDTLLMKLREWNDWITTHIPEIADTISRTLVPVLKDAYAIFRDIGEVLGTVAEGFAYLIGYLYRDKSLQEAGNTFEKLAKAAAYLSGTIRDIVDSLTGMVRLIKAIMTGDWGKIGEIIEDIKRSVLHGPEDRKAALSGGTPSPSGASAAPRFLGAGIAPTRSSATSLADQARQIAQDIAAKTGARADLIFAQMAYETNGFKNRGTMQLNNLAGITNPGGAGYQSFASLEEFKQRFLQILSLGRYQGVFSAQTPEQYLAALHQGERGGYSEQPYNLQGFVRYAGEMLARGREAVGKNTYAADYRRDGGGYSRPALIVQQGGGDTNIGSINVSVPPGWSMNEAKQLILKTFEEKAGKLRSRLNAEGSGPLN